MVSLDRATRAISDRPNTFAWLMLFGLAALLRWMYLDLKPPHFDEGVNGWFVLQMWNHGFFKYDPTNFHGPLYFYILQLTDLFFENDLIGYRWVTGLISMASIWFVYKIGREWGGKGWLAAIFLALSPAQTFFSRYAIHESLFQLTQILFLYGVILWIARSDRRGWIWIWLGCFGLVTTKETWTVYGAAAFFAMIGGLVWARFWGKAQLREDLTLIHERLCAHRRLAIAGLLLSTGAALYMYSGFGAHPKGMRDAFMALMPWIQTGLDGAHEKSIYHYLELFLFHEPYALLGLLATVYMIFHAARSRHLGILIVSFWFLFNFMIYSLIPYKTPWLIMNLNWPFALAADWVYARLKSRGVLDQIIQGGLLALMAFLLVQSLRLNFQNYEDPQEDYVYVQTRMPMHSFKKHLRALAGRDPSFKNLKMTILVDSVWPLPWYFSEYDLHYSVESIRDQLSDVIWVDEARLEEIRPQLQGDYSEDKVQLRDAYGMIYILQRRDRFTEEDLWSP